jgi:alanine racemase
VNSVVSFPASRQMDTPLSENIPRLRIELGAIRANYAEMRRRYRGQLLSAVVKSDAYGTGLVRVVAALAGAGCEVFWANDLEEARRVRSVVSAATVYTLMGLGSDHIRDFEQAGVVPALTSLAELEHCARHGLLAGKKVAVGIQIDTGLGRLGLCDDELRFLATRPELLEPLDIRLWATHLAAYNLPGDPANAEQRDRLRNWLRGLPAAPISLSASSCVFMSEDWHFDVARVGSALYGVQTSVQWQDGLKPCYELSAPIVRIAEHPAGRRLGYRGVSELTRPSRIATVAIGYANGLPQRFAEIGSARLAGVSVPLVGGIAMNLTMLDITDVPDQALAGDMRAIFFDERQPLEPVAERLDCAPNVLLAQIGAGTRKFYTGE